MSACAESRVAVLLSEVEEWDVCELEYNILS